ncbi:Anthranilate phosphoribosyltransferase [Duganella sp. CF402]|uniref:DNA-binding protein YbiB n=1 Tax=unclassified Duganella TaxID=2636909 RepID=UPI0008CE8C97|nr:MULTISPECIES: DNA-binding protein YbiB [unclassified Duganella]RZT08653.1 anthranilate phosphoribosyltransferase [Duganella sp. BK701]SEL86418.1 Anthranilate phosphoribosyltransferase [Duganella sp. CF402]
MTTFEPFPAARFIKEIGRGKNGARSMTRDDAHDLYQAMLDGRVSDLELGGILLSMRIKGESVEEIAGFLDAAEAAFEPFNAPPGQFAPVVIPTYNGARKMANLTPLLAMLLAREGVPVLVHGVATDLGRVATAEVFAELGVPAARHRSEAEESMSQGKPAFITIETMAPKLAHMLSLRRILGVRNSTHTLVKIMQPFAGPALRLVSYTHPEYLEMLGEYFTTAAPHERGDAFLMRGTEGETVANANKAQQIDWFHGGLRTTLVPKQTLVGELPLLPENKDAATTAAWIKSVLDGAVPVPPPIAEQVAQCLLVSRTVASRQHVSEPIA